MGIAVRNVLLLTWRVLLPKLLGFDFDPTDPSSGCHDEVSNQSHSRDHDRETYDNEENERPSAVVISKFGKKC